MLLSEVALSFVLVPVHTHLDTLLSFVDSDLLAYEKFIVNNTVLGLIITWALHSDAYALSNKPRTLSLPNSWSLA